MADTSVGFDTGVDAQHATLTDGDGDHVSKVVNTFNNGSDVPTDVSTSSPMPTVQTGTPALPTGAATEAKQDTGNTSLATIASTVSGTEVQVDVLTSALPAGAATQATLATIDVDTGVIAVDTTSLDGKIPAIPTGGGTEAAAVRVTMATDSTGQMTVDGTVTANLGTIAGAATEVTSAAILVNTGTIGTSLNNIEAGYAAEGSALGSGVLIQGDDGTDRQNIAVDVSGNVQTNIVTSALPTGGSTAALQTTGNASLATLAGTVAGSEQQVDIVASLPAGTNNIGDVDVLTQPARVATTDNIGVAQQTNQLMDGTTSLIPLFAVIDESSSGNNTLVAAVPTKKIRVLALFLVVTDAIVVRFEDGASGTALSGQMSLANNSGFVLPYNPLGWFETGVNTLLNMELDDSKQVSGTLQYVEV